MAEQASTPIDSGARPQGGNGSGARKSRALPHPKTEAVKSTYATIFPRPDIGQRLPEEFVEMVHKLEVMVKAPIWLLVQNGDADFCCDHICQHALDGFLMQRKDIREGQPAALLIHSPGGNAHYAYTIARIFQRRTQHFTAIVPSYAKSAATLLALGASRLIIGRDAELGPLDVQMRDRDREEIGSALDAVQSLEQLNEFSLTAVDQLMMLLKERTGKRTDILLPLALNYATAFVRPLLEKIDTVDYTRKSRELRVAEEYAVRLMQKNYPIKVAKEIAARLVKRYPTHGFVIDRQEAVSPIVSEESFGLGLRAQLPSPEMELLFEEMLPYLDQLSVIGRLVEVKQ